MPKHNIKVVELFAGVGGFRIGLEGASDAYETIWNNQWEPSTQHQDASLVYRARFDGLLVTYSWVILTVSGRSHNLVLRNVKFNHVCKVFK